MKWEIDISDNNSLQKNLSPSIDPISQATLSEHLIYTRENPNPNPNPHSKTVF